MHTLPVNALGGRDNDAPDAGSQAAALQELRGGGHVGKLAIGAGANDDLVDGDVLPLPGGMGVFRQMRVGHGAVHLAQVDLHGALILRVRVRLIGGPGAVNAALHVGLGHAVHGKNAVLGAGLDGHVGDGQPVIDGQLRHAGACKFQRLVAGAVHADHADEGQDHILAGDVGFQFSGQVHPDGGGHLEPGLTRRHGRAHIRGADAGGEGAQSAVGAGVGIGADDGLAGGHQPLLRQEGVLDAHGAHVVVVADIELPGKGPALLALGGGLDVLVGGEMIHHQGDAALVEHLVEARRLKLVDGHRGGNVVAQHQVQSGLDELSGPHAFKARVLGQNFLCHCHSHARRLLQAVASIILLMPLT